MKKLKALFLFLFIFVTSIGLSSCQLSSSHYKEDLPLHIIFVLIIALVLGVIIFFIVRYIRKKYY